MSNSFFIALTLGMAAVTFLIRFSFIGLEIGRAHV